MVAVREGPLLQRQEDASRVDEVDAREAVLQRYLLRANVLLYGDGEIGAALDGGVVGDDQDLAAVDDAHAGDEARGRRLVVVHVPGGEGAELEEGRVAVEETFQAVAHQHLAALNVALALALGTHFADLREPLAVLGDHRKIHVAVLLELVGIRIYFGLESEHETP